VAFAKHKRNPSNCRIKSKEYDKELLTIAWRNFRKQILFFINVAGLAIGVAACLAIVCYCRRAEL